MQIRLIHVITLALVLAVALARSVPAGTGTNIAERETPVQYSVVGIVPFHDRGDVREGAERFIEILQARLAARFEEVEFIVVDPEKVDAETGPLLLDEAVKLGSEYGCDALVDGVFYGVEIVGGTWPNTASDTPEARGKLKWRLVECSGGSLLLDGRLDPGKPKVYSRRIRSEDELIRRVMQGMAAEVGDRLGESGFLAGTPPPEGSE